MRPYPCNSAPWPAAGSRIVQARTWNRNLLPNLIVPFDFNENYSAKNLAKSSSIPSSRIDSYVSKRST